MSVALDPAARARILDFVKPLSVSLDGMTNFGFVERRLGVVERLLEESRRLDPALAVDEDLLFLLAAFAGLPERRVAPGSRADLLLRSAGIAEETLSQLYRSLRRFEASPARVEESLVRDAGLLETVGAYGVAQAIVAGVHDRMTLRELAEDIDAKMASASFSTEVARRLAVDRIELGQHFARRLAAEVEEFEKPDPA
ncbi:MAG TPA: hypothetical protein VGR00_11355 [Thermoanaerobaculia bacterium]|nr:hypothetical protein [Thermoanaerobaculia bacterium]